MKRLWSLVLLLTNVQFLSINHVCAVSPVLAEHGNTVAMINNIEGRNKYEPTRVPTNVIDTTSRCRPNLIGRYIVRAHGNYTDDTMENERRKTYPLLEKYNACQHSNDDKEKLVYRSPDYVWGKEVTTNMTKQICEACVLAHGNDAEVIRFTKRGMIMCSKLCGKMDMNILRVGPTLVILKDYYCTKKLLKSAKCVCVYKITCQEYNNFMFINLLPNRTGEIAILYYEVENS